MWPMAALLTASLLVLLLWTVLDPLVWYRNVVDDISGESFGSCQSDSIKIFGPLQVLVLSPPTFLTAWMAWKTKDVDQLYTESWWIFVMIATQVEIVVVAAPVIVILSDVSTEGRYILMCFMMAGYPLSILGFIFGPKVFAEYAERKGVDRTQVASRGSTQGVRVSGITAPANPAQQRQSTTLAEMTNSRGSLSSSALSVDHSSGVKGDCSTAMPP